MQSPTNGILVTRQGMLDDITLDVSVRRDALAFATRVYVSERELRSEVAKLTLALEQVFDAPEPPDIFVALGPKMPNSTSFEIAIQIDRLGHARIVVSMVARFLDVEPLGSDTCTINLVSDLASLDSFAAQLRDLSNTENSTAQLSAE